MHRPRPIPFEVNTEAEDLAFGRKAMRVLVVVNLLLLLIFVAASSGIGQELREIPMWLWLVQGAFFLLAFAPMFFYRLIRRRERTSLAAAKSLHWFVEAVGLAA